MNLRDRRRFASLTAACGLLDETCFDQNRLYPLPPPPMATARSPPSSERELSYFPFPSFAMDLLEYEARCLDMVRQSLRPRNLAAFDDGPKSNCCIASLQRVGDELYACSACGALCSDAGSDL